MTDISLLDDVSKQADALGQAFKDNQADISRLHMLYDNLETQWLKEKSEFDELVLNGNSLVSQLCVLEEERSRRQKAVNKLEKDIEKTTTDYEDMMRKAFDKTSEYESMKREVSEYTLKMSSYTKAVSEVESNTPLQRQVTKVKDEIELLKAKKSDLMKWRSDVLTNANDHVNTKVQLKSEIAALEQQIKERRDAYEDKKRGLESAQEKRKGAEMTTFVLTKRNSALFIRMKRKVDDQMEKHSTFIAQIDYLVKMIDKTKQKLEGFGASQ